MSEYKRLTAKKEDRYWEQEEFWQSAEEPSYEEIEELYSRFAELEDKIESGRLVELPCKVGDTIYYVEYFCNYKGCSTDIQTYCCGCKEMIERERKHEKYVIAEKKFRLTDLSQIGKKYLLTKESAEARLKELQEADK